MFLGLLWSVNVLRQIEVSSPSGGGGELNLRNTSGLTLFGIKFTPTSPFSEKCKISTPGYLIPPLFALPCMYVVVSLVHFYMINSNCPYFVELARKPSKGNRVNPCSNYLEKCKFCSQDVWKYNLIRHYSQVHQDVELPAIEQC